MSTLRTTKKWNPTPPPPPSPKILHFHRRLHRRRPPAASLHHRRRISNKHNLLNLFDQENNNLSDCKHRSKIAKSQEEEEDEEELVNGEHTFRGGGGFLAEDDKWRFQAEILRAECNFLRMEREFAQRKLEKNKVKMERTLRAAVETLASGRKKIDEGGNVNAVFEEEIEDLADKLKELRKTASFKDCHVRKSSNFDKKAMILQHRLEKLGGLSDHRSFQEFQELSTNWKENVHEGMMEEKSSKYSFDRGEEEGSGSMLSSTAHSSVSSCASTSMRIDSHQLSNSAKKSLQQETVLQEEDKCSSGRFKAVIRRILEQVRAETEQWSQMQEMIAKVHGEMEQLQNSRAFWENRANEAENEARSLKQALKEWKEKALSYEAKATNLEQQLRASLSEEEEAHHKSRGIDSLGKQLERAKLSSSNRSTVGDSSRRHKVVVNLTIRDMLPVSLGKRLEKAKGVLVAKKRSPLKNIGNSSPFGD